jgi:hypothetical protein
VLSTLRTIVLALPNDQLNAGIREVASTQNPPSLAPEPWGSGSKRLRARAPRRMALPTNVAATNLFCCHERLLSRALTHSALGLDQAADSAHAQSTGDWDLASFVRAVAAAARARDSSDPDGARDAALCARVLNFQCRLLVEHCAARAMGD